MTREEILGAISEDKIMPFIQPEQLAGIVDFVIENYKPELPSNVDEAAEKYAKENCENYVDTEDGVTYIEEAVRNTFKAGARWRDAQIPKLPDSIDEAAVQFAQRAYSPFDDPYETSKSFENDVNCFKAGAEWMAEQVNPKLTPEDVKAIFNKVRDVQIKYVATEGCYQEVAGWFNDKGNRI